MSVKRIVRSNPKTFTVKKIIRSNSITHNDKIMKRKKEEKDRKDYNDAINKIKFTWVTCPDYEEKIIEKCKKGKEIAEIVRAINNENDIYLMEINDDAIFEEAIDIYENNQAFWYQREDYDELLKLEEWFICIIETMPCDEEEIKEWRLREEYKLSNWCSYYCCDELKDKIKVNDIRIRKKVREKLKSFGIFYKGIKEDG